MIEVINELKRVENIEAGDLVVQYDKVYRVLGIWYSRATCDYTIDLAGNGDEYETYPGHVELPTVRLMIDARHL